AAVPADRARHQRHDQDARAEARDRRLEREVQGRRSSQGPRSNGALAEAQREPDQGLLAADGVDARVVRAVHDAADRGRAVSHPVFVAAGPVVGGPVLHSTLRHRHDLVLPAAADAATGRRGAAEDDAVPDAGHVYGFHAVFAGRPRGIYVHERRARYPPTTSYGMARAPLDEV